MTARCASAAVAPARTAPDHEESARATSKPKPNSKFEGLDAWCAEIGAAYEASGVAAALDALDAYIARTPGAEQKP